MPRVKIDYVVSFSSEDPEHPANNLLEWEVSKKKWLCKKGETLCSVVLQLVKAVQIESINIGAHHAASVEVLVGLSERPNDPFEVLVPSVMLLSPAESRRGGGARVRSFSAAQLAAPRARRWDRLRLVCAQPYDKHAQFGLSFVHVHSPERPALALAPDASDDEDFRPGELFARRHALRPSVDAQIRQASMEAIKKNSDRSTKLLKIPISKAPTDGQAPSSDDAAPADRRKESLMYADDDGRPHERIDKVVQRHKQQKDKDRTADGRKPGQNRDRDKATASSAANGQKKAKKSERENSLDRKPQEGNQSDSQAFEDSGARDAAARSGRRKRKRSSEGAALRGVVFALSGYENPLRAQLRAAALALGARYAPAPAAACTHLVCAFPNTPKLAAARAAGWRAAAVSGAWLQACARAARRLPWRWFALEPAERRAPPAGWERRLEDDAADDEDTEMDTDDEIEEVLKRQEKKKRSESPARGPDSSVPARAADEPDGAAAARVSDAASERGSGSDTDVDAERERAPERIDTEKELPAFFEGLTFALAPRRAPLARYIRAYGGLVLHVSEVLDEGSVHYHVCEGGACAGGGACAPPEWVWRCHRLKALVPLSDPATS